MAPTTEWITQIMQQNLHFTKKYTNSKHIENITHSNVATFLLSAVCCTELFMERDEVRAGF